jgi:hypothetical protein
VLLLEILSLIDVNRYWLLGYYSDRSWPRFDCNNCSCNILRLETWKSDHEIREELAEGQNGGDNPHEVE